MILAELKAKPLQEGYLQSSSRGLKTQPGVRMEIMIAKQSPLNNNQSETPWWKLHLKPLGAGILGIAVLAAGSFYLGGSRTSSSLHPVTPTSTTMSSTASNIRTTSTLSPVGTGYLVTGANIRQVADWACTRGVGLSAPGNPYQALEAGKPVRPVEKECFGPNMPAMFKGGTPVQVRIALKGASGQVSTGPIVMAFNDLSDTQLFVAYGGNYLWLYDSLTTLGSVALSVSMSTGKVVSSVKVPSLARVIGYATSSGLWLGSLDSGTATLTVYHVSSSGRVDVLRNVSYAEFSGHELS